MDELKTAFANFTENQNLSTETVRNMLQKADTSASDRNSGEIKPWRKFIDKQTWRLDDKVHQSVKEKELIFRT